MLSDVRPAVHEKIRIGFHFREFDPHVGLERVPKVAAAIAHELHFGLVFFVARNKFAPIVLQAELLDQQVVRRRAVVRQFRPLRNPIPQGGEHHAAGRRPQFFRVELAESVAGGIEGDLQIGVFGDSALVGSAGGDALGPRRGEAHLIDPNVPVKLRFHRPFLACVEASVHPKLGGFDVDSGDFGDDPIRAVQHYQRQYLPYLLRRQLRRRKRGARRIGVVPMASRALVPGDSIAPLPVFDERGVANRAPRVPFAGFGQRGLSESRSLQLSPRGLRDKQIDCFGNLLVGHGFDRRFVQHKNPFRLLGGVPREGLSPNNQTRAASQPSLIVWQRHYTVGVFIQRLLVSLVKMVLPLIPRDENIYFGIFYSDIFTFTYA